MNLKSILTALVLTVATSSIAVADGSTGTVELHARAQTVLYTAHLPGTPDALAQLTFDMRHTVHFDKLTFGWVHGNTAIKHVVVNYANGTSKTYAIGDAVTQGPNHRYTRTVMLDKVRVNSITVVGYGYNGDSKFSVLGMGGRGGRAAEKSTN